MVPIYTMWFRQYQTAFVKQFAGRFPLKKRSAIKCEGFYFELNQMDSQEKDQDFWFWWAQSQWQFVPEGSTMSQGTIKWLERRECVCVCVLACMRLRALSPEVGSSKAGCLGRDARSGRMNLQSDVELSLQGLDCERRNSSFQVAVKCFYWEPPSDQ